MQPQVVLYVEYKTKATFNIREQQTLYIPSLQVLKDGRDVFIHTIYLLCLGSTLRSVAAVSTKPYLTGRSTLLSGLLIVQHPSPSRAKQMRYDCPVLSRLPLLEPHLWSDGISQAASFWLPVLHKSHCFLEAVGDGGLSTLLSWKPLDTNQLHGEPSLLQR